MKGKSKRSEGTHQKNATPERARFLQSKWWGVNGLREKKVYSGREF